MYLVDIDDSICTGCGQCVEACPAQILGQNEEKKAAVTGNAAECMGCLSCVALCESGAVTVDEY